MSSFIRTQRRYLLLAVVMIALTVLAIGIGTASRVRALTPADCAGECRPHAIDRHKW